ncbi:MAG: hypothetical protein WB952_06405 [Terriglobales bacterium]
MKKAALFLMLMATVLVTAATSFAATSVASLKGVYNFQVAGFSNENGYYSGSTWVVVTGTCPTNQHCFTQAFPRLTYGTLSFDGAGHATFTSVTGVNQGSGGPTKGAVWAYSVSGFNGALGTATNGAYLTLGSFNSAGVATVVTIRTAGGNPNTGVATLQ